MNTAKKPLALAFAGILGLSLLGGCAAEAETPTAAQSSAEAQDSGVLEKFELTGVDGRALVDELEATPLADRREDLIASVRADHLAIIDIETEEEGQIPLPDDAFYLSIAPYVSQTHPCGFHSLTTCVGELQNVEVDVTIVDETGNTIFDEAVTTQDNGFFGLWLPRDVEGEITLQHDGKSVTGPFSTADDAKTCETDLQLA